MRDKYLSNLLAFKRDYDVSTVLQALSGYGGQQLVIALDGETFGHHYNEGIYMLDILINELSVRGHSFNTLSELVDNSNIETPSTDLLESTWGASNDEIAAGIVYPFWEDASNATQKKLWELFDVVANDYLTICDTLSIEGYETVAFWDSDKVAKLADEQVQKSLTLMTAANATLQSDQFWWASRKVLPSGQILFDKELLYKALELYSSYTNLRNVASLTTLVTDMCTNIKKSLE
jgi:hypothetical protein